MLAEPPIRSNLREVCLVEPALRDRLAPPAGERSVFDLDELVRGATEIQADMVLGVVVTTVEYLTARIDQLWNWVREHPEFDLQFIIFSDQAQAAAAFSPLPAEYIHLVLPKNFESQHRALGDIFNNAFHNLRLRHEKLQLQSRLALSSQELQRITEVGQAMSTERDFDVLIELILRYAREMVAADSGSIYVIERGKGGKPATHLRFKKSALNLSAGEFLLPIDANSIAGYVAMTGLPLLIEDCHALTGEEDYSFNFEFDKAHNYYTKSMMVIPMKNHKDEVIGVIQLINRKRHFSHKLSVREMEGEAVIPFSDRCVELTLALSGQAAVAIQNSLLIQDINNLFEGFVTASVTAIEQRDPTTSGHSFRVAEFTTGLAKAVDRLNSGVFANDRFNIEQIRELRYASLLHDFGKVGVREEVLVKAKKLYPFELDAIEGRFKLIFQLAEKHYLNKKIKYLKNNGRKGFDEYESYLDREMAEKLAEIQEMLDVIRNSNEPTVVEAGNFARLEEITRKKARLPGGELIPFLRENELLSLSIRRGNLDQKERMEIESHVSHTYRFLIQIPWTGDLARVPDIAHGHHEKLDGSGYPMGLRGDEIALQTRMMTIADIFDALTAPDRPYKKSLPMERALDILKLEANEKRLDTQLLDVFIESGVFRIIEDQPPFEE
ncbi:MAG: GAF domain-containing protein [bacterium]|nr:GAF domain-containing protein [bacterium]